MALPSHSVNAYTIGWIAALHHELAAALEMLDKEHDAPTNFHKNESDSNSYSWGRIGKHHVVIASLPSGEYGTAAAADTAAGLRSSLPRIKIGLLVGIGAGITGETTNEDGTVTVEREIFLGDVVVSNPNGANGGLVQHDVQKVSMVDGQQIYQLNGFLNGPPRALRAPLSNLRARHERKGSNIAEFMEVFQKNKKMRRPYGYPGAGQDPLRQALIQQSDASNYGDEDEGIRDSPEIHYGTIASGDKLIKTAEERDSIARWLQNNNIDPICFEMEARGIMNSFPCLVIRGICDYADERKNDKWQRYAAATAAAFAKELLLRVDAPEVEKEKGIGELMEKMDLKLDEINARTTNINSNTTSIYDRSQAEENQRILDFLTTDDHSHALNKSLEQHMEGTGAWFFESPEFISWMSHEGSSFLECSGEPGAGKTVLAASTILHLQMETRQDRDSTVLYLFCDYSRRDNQTIIDLLSSLLRQASSRFAGRSGIVPPLVVRMDENYRRHGRRPTQHEMTAALDEALPGFKQSYIVIDALDECGRSCRGELLGIIQSFECADTVKCLTTSRRDPSISELLHSPVKVDIEASNTDIELYITSHIRKMQGYITIDQDLKEEIVQRVSKAGGRLFQLVKLHMQSLANNVSVGGVKSSLEDLSSDYTDAYNAAMQRIQTQPEQIRELAFSTLEWISCAEKPLRDVELQHALAVRLTSATFDPDSLVNVHLIFSACAGLVDRKPSRYFDDLDGDITFLDVQTMVFSHFTVSEYFQETQNRWFPDAKLHLSQICFKYQSYCLASAGNPIRKNWRADVEAGGPYAFAYYACQQFKHHANALERLGCNKAMDTLALTILQYSNSSTRAVLACEYDYIRGDYRWEITSVWEGITREGNARLCKSLLAHGRTIHVPDSQGRLPLSTAAVFSDERVITALFTSFGLFPPDSSGRSPLWLAAQAGSVYITKMLAEADISSINLADSQGRTPLGIAVSRRHLEVVKYLCEVDQLDPNLDSRDWPVYSAVELSGGFGSTKEYEIVKTLFQRDDLDANVWGNDGETPLSRAVIEGDLSMVKLLLETGRVQVAMESAWGATPLLHSMLCTSEEIPGLLLGKDDPLDNCLLRGLSQSVQNHIAERFVLDIEDGWKRYPEFERHVLWKTYVIWCLEDRCSPPPCGEINSATLAEVIPALLDYGKRLDTLSEVDAEVARKSIDPGTRCYVCLEDDLHGGLHCQECSKNDVTASKADLCYHCAAKGHWCGSEEFDKHHLQDMLCFLRTGKIPFPLRVFEPEVECDLASARALLQYHAANVVCDTCGDIGIAKGLRCSRCSPKDFDLCPDCVKLGRWCLDKSHLLQEYGETGIPRDSYPWRSFSAADPSAAGSPPYTIQTPETFQGDLSHTKLCRDSEGPCVCPQAARSTRDWPEVRRAEYEEHDRDRRSRPPWDLIYFYV